MAWSYQTIDDKKVKSYSELIQEIESKLNDIAGKDNEWASVTTSKIAYCGVLEGKPKGVIIYDNTFNVNTLNTRGLKRDWKDWSSDKNSLSKIVEELIYEINSNKYNNNQIAFSQLMLNQLNDDENSYVITMLYRDI